ncbi:hypothetical protein CSKR_109482 [Clonorchis sinensis]|uniref:Uncharacterized protein n=1 Tax=Clonorchis sinensis TaxID=79923 RepID=A0A419QHF8_CLOSI|nr:hypothetical protein CSKR_109482 [Clonorchis sinensis]
MHLGSCLGLGEVTISLFSRFLQVVWQLGTEEVLQLNDFNLHCLAFWGFICVVLIARVTRIHRAKLLTGRSVVRAQPPHIDCSCLGLGDPAVSQPSYFLQVTGSATRHRKGLTADRLSLLLRK